MATERCTWPEGYESEEEKKPLVGYTTTNKAAYDHVYFESVIGGTFKHTFSGGKVSGEDGKYATFDVGM
jgi:hypothetical protein